MQKRLSDILSQAGIISSTALSDPLILGLAFDSRTVQKDFLFFALPGVHVNGNLYIRPAIERGATAVMYQGQLPPDITADTCPDVAFIQVEDSRFSMAAVSDSFYDSPSSRICVLGVTGTEGKSTTVYLLWQLLRLCGEKCGFISTVSYSLGSEDMPNPEHQTTPEAPLIDEKLSLMIHNGCTFAVIESSSHGLSKKTNRLGAIKFDAAAFMNVTHEHLEFHGTKAQYRFDKANLFRALDSHNHIKNGRTIPSVAVVNLDDESAGYFSQATQKETIGFTIAESFTVPENISTIYHADNIRDDASGVSFDIEEAHRTDDTFSVQTHTEARINIPGRFNVYNTLAAVILVSSVLQKSVADILPLLPKLKPVKGRMSTINCGQPFSVIVDYAHTPSSFNAIFPPLKAQARARIIALFGSAGERDTQKRSQQGEIASKYSDILVLTDEDPRGEDSMDILEQIVRGCTGLERDKTLFLIPDRPQALRKAFSIAQKDDIVLLLGKGHENSIIYQGRVMPYDEIIEAEKALKESGYNADSKDT